MSATDPSVGQLEFVLRIVLGHALLAVPQDLGRVADCPDPERRNRTSGRAFARALPLANGDPEYRVMVSVAAVGTVARQLKQLSMGDTITIASRLRPMALTKDGETKVALDQVADQILTTHHVRRKRAAIDGDVSLLTGSAGDCPAARVGGPTRRAFARPPEDEEWLPGGAQ